MTLKAAVKKEYAVLKSKVPYDTGNMRYNATRLVEYDDRFEIFIDENIAPYVPYTNEPWISPKWRGKKNPNEKWFDKAAEEFVEGLAKRLGGKME